MFFVKRISILLFCFFSIKIFAQENPYNPSVISHKIQGLENFGRVLYIAAHPDDENTRLIPWLTHSEHYTTAYLSLTRGDGGQNLIGDEQGTDLGLIRTRELLAARRIDGACQFFTRAFDFGFSKNPEETFEKWNKEEILKDVVTIIRFFKPDIIIMRFPTTGEGGHGHHTASAILASEAFDLAANPAYVDHHNLSPWKTTRLLWNTFNFGGNNLTDSTQFKVDVGGFNTLLGVSYGEIAARSRSQHRSQGFGTAPVRSRQYEYFKTIKGTAPVKSLMDGVDFSAARLNKEDIDIKKLQQNFELLRKPGITTDLQTEYLLNILDLCKASSSLYVQELDAKVRDILWAISGIYAEAYSKHQVITNPKLAAGLVVNNRNNFTRVDLELFGNTSAPISNITHLDTLLEVNLSADRRTAPYALKREPDGNRFERFLIEPVYAEPAFHGKINVKFLKSGRSFEYSLNHFPIRYKKLDPSKGEMFDALCFTNPVSIAVKNENAIVPVNKKVSLDIEVKNFSKDTLRNSLIFIRSNDADIRVKQNNLLTANVDLMYPGEQRIINLTLDASVFKTSFTAYPVFRIENSRAEYTEQLCEIKYEHIPSQFYLKTDSVKILVMDLKEFNGKIAYVPGAGDKVAECLREIGYTVELLSNENLASADLSQYKAIITGVRAYNINEKLSSYHPKLMQYIKDGGGLIVQYNTNNRIGPVVAPMGPFPFTISRNRVTDENAEVKFIDSSSSFLNSPYKISSEDFKGWIQERGIYFVAERDSNYRTLFTMKDPGEKENDGSLIWCDYGKGKFIYTGLVFFRELPAGVAGAYRLMINLIEAK